MRTVVISRLPSAAPMAALRWPTLVAGGLALAVILAARGQSMALAGLAAVLLAAGAALIDRRLVIPLVIAIMPLEILQKLSFEQGSSGLVGRFMNSTLINVRLAILAAGAYWVVTARPGWQRLLPRGRLVLPAFALLALYVFGTIYTLDLGPEHLPQNENALVPLGSASGEAVLNTASLALHLALFMLIPMLVRDWPTFRLCLWTFVAVAVVLAVAGVYQQVTGVFFWNPALGLVDTPRINATFRDPNIFARVLIMAIVLAVAMAFAAPRRWRLGLLAGLIAPCALAVIFTNSRSGFLITAGALPLIVALMPLSYRARMLAIVGAAVSVVALALVAVVVFNAHLLDRVATLGEGERALGPRQILIEGGWRMFLDHPLFGVGLAGFQDAFQGPYRHFYALLEYRVSLSHTDVITILAELGIVGGTVVAFLFFRFFTTIIDLRRATAGGNRVLVTGMAVAVLVIALSAQAEGRLLSEPYLWLMLGLALAAEGIVRRERGIDPAD